MLNHKKVVKKGLYTPPGPADGQTAKECLAQQAEMAENVNFKVDCEAEAQELEEEADELLAQMEEEEEEEEEEEKGEEAERPAIGDPVAHAAGDMVNVEAAGAGEIAKPTADAGGMDAWDAGAASEQMFGAEDEVQGITYQPRQDETVFWVGLQGHAERAIEGHEADFVFAHSNAGWLEIWEDGQYVFTVTRWDGQLGRDVGRWSKDSVMEIAVNGQGQVEYKVDGDLVYTSQAQVVYPMVATAAFKTPGAGLKNFNF